MFVKEFNIFADLDTPDPVNFDHPRAFFLSHTHTDHLNGFFGPIVSNYLKNNSTVKIYMTELSYLFIKHMRTFSSDSWIFDHINILSIGTTIVTLPADCKRGLEELLLTVKVLPASHSLGSVMFLFKTPTCRVLFTGDFRITEADVEKYADFQDRNLDAMYVDTTFLNRNNFFPKRSVVVELLTEKMQKWLDRGSDRRVGISASAMTGYEDVFNQIFLKLGHKVYVDKQELKLFYRAIADKVPGVTDSPDSRIHLCAYNADTEHKKCFSDSKNTLNYLTVRLSAMKWVLQDSESEFYNQQENKLNICYATHCSDSELKYFINYFNCPRIVGHPYEYRSTKGSPDSKDIIEGSLKRKYFSPKKICEKTVVPAKVVKSLLLCCHGDD